MKHIEELPRSRTGEEMRLKVNEIIVKSNQAFQRIEALEAAVEPTDNAKLIEALKQADNAIQKAIAHFSKEVK